MSWLDDKIRYTEDEIDKAEPDSLQFWKALERQRTLVEIQHKLKDLNI